MRHAGLDVWMLTHGREGQANAQSSFICNGLNQKAAKRLWTNDMGETALEHTIPHLCFNGKSSWLYRNERHLFYLQELLKGENKSMNTRMGS